MSLYFADAALCDTNDELLAWWNIFLPNSDIQEIWETGWSTGSVADTPMPPPRGPSNQMPMLNTLYWPTGLSRWAKFYGIVTEDTLAAIRYSCTNNVSAQLIIKDDDTGTPITCNMYLMAVYPISMIGNLLVDANGAKLEHQLFLISLVDKRYFYWQKTGVVNTLTSWSAWFGAAYTLLGTSATIASINSAYKTPSYKFVDEHKPLPLLIDAAARLLGQRIQVNLDDTIYHKDYATALSEANTLHTSLAAYKVAGEFIPTEDLIRPVPYQMKALFKSTDNTYTEFTKSLGSLAISEYDGYTGTTGNSQIYYSDYIYVHYSAYNTICQALTDQAALDFYGWQLMPPHITYAGIQNWTALACSDFVMWQHNGTIITKINREPFWVSPCNTEDPEKETQVVRIPSSPTYNAYGDSFGYIQEYDYINNLWRDSTEVWVRSTDDTTLAPDMKYICKFIYYPVYSKPLYEAQLGGNFLWVRITDIPSADPGPYEGNVGHLNSSGVWVDDSPTRHLTEMYRVQSNQLPPRIPVNQVVLVVPEPGTPGHWRITGWGGEFYYKRKVYLGSYCDGGNIVNVYTYEYWGARDFCISPAPPP